MKIDKYIAYSGYSSRRKACDLIDEKRVVVNGKIATFSTKIKEDDVVLIDPNISIAYLIYIMK